MQPKCAVSSASRLVGRPLAGLARRLRTVSSRHLLHDLDPFSKRLQSNARTSMPRLSAGTMRRDVRSCSSLNTRSVRTRRHASQRRRVRRMRKTLRLRLHHLRWVWRSQATKPNEVENAVESFLKRFQPGEWIFNAFSVAFLAS